MTTPNTAAPLPTPGTLTQAVAGHCTLYKAGSKLDKREAQLSQWEHDEL